jgi:FkbM family methyltransferase
MDAGTGDLVMDVGANIGVASSLFLDMGCRVVAYEPEHECFELACQNAVGAELHEVAVIVGKDPTVTLNVYNGPNKGLHSVVVTKNRVPTIVSAVCFQDELDRLQPTHVKVDVEGLEHALIMGSTLPASVRQVAVELEFRGRKDLRPKCEEVIQRLFGDEADASLQQFTYIQHCKTYDNWYTVCTRNIVVKMSKEKPEKCRWMTKDEWVKLVSQ